MFWSDFLSNPISNGCVLFSESLKATAAVEDIVEKLPKVWKVLIELLSHQNTSNTNSSEKVTTCYKSVNTASGPVLVPSVSQTYIRLKVSDELIAFIVLNTASILCVKLKRDTIKINGFMNNILSNKKFVRFLNFGTEPISLVVFVKTK